MRKSTVALSPFQITIISASHDKETLISEDVKISLAKLDSYFSFLQGVKTANIRHILRFYPNNSRDSKNGKEQTN